LVEAPAQKALRVLGFDDAWPTELTMREIRRRYMREALLNHPDKGSAAEKDWRTVKFQEIAEAYAVLESSLAILERTRSGEDATETSEGAAGDADRAAKTADLGEAEPHEFAIEAGMLALEGGDTREAADQHVAEATRKPASDAVKMSCTGKGCQIQ
jgi:DnaJ-class molecular chaperone